MIKKVVLLRLFNHTVTPSSGFIRRFCTCFDEADTVIVADVYAAGEAPIERINKEKIDERIKAHGHRHVLTLDHAEDLATHIAQIAQSGDVVICLGAGNITTWAHALPRQLDHIWGNKFLI